jgi:MYXO-CTERM domain-containing protein
MRFWALAASAISEASSRYIRTEPWSMEMSARVDIQPGPEPGTLAMGPGIIGMAGLLRRKRRG